VVSKPRIEKKQYKTMRYCWILCSANIFAHKMGQKKKERKGQTNAPKLQSRFPLIGKDSWNNY